MWLSFLLLVLGGDWLGARFERELAERAQASCGREFRMALGSKGPVAAIRELAGGEESKEIYVQFLKDRHGYAIGRVNEIYERSVTSFTELLTDNFQGVDERKQEVAEDDASFREIMLARWQRAAAKGARACRGTRTVSVRLEKGELIVTWPR